MENRPPARNPKVPGPVFAEDRSKAPGPPQRFASLLRPFERWLSSPAPSDPLYLSNRTVGRRALVWLMVVIPLVAIGIAMYLSLNRTAAKPSSRPVTLTPAEEAA